MLFKVIKQSFVRTEKTILTEGKKKILIPPKSKYNFDRLVAFRENKQNMKTNT